MSTHNKERVWPAGEHSILYPGKMRLQAYDRRSWMARFADGLAAMDDMTEHVRAEQQAGTWTLGRRQRR